MEPTRPGAPRRLPRSCDRAPQALTQSNPAPQRKGYPNESSPGDASREVQFEEVAPVVVGRRGEEDRSEGVQSLL